MLVSYFSPIAPAVILLLGAFILSTVIPRLPARWQTHQGIQYLGAPTWVGLAVLVLLGVRLTLGEDPTGEGLELLSGWSFSTAETVAALTIRADSLSLLFLIVILLILLVVTLAPSSLLQNDRPSFVVLTHGGSLAVGAGACFLFVSANGLTLGYATFGFDILTALYWLSRKQIDLGVARLFLGIFTVMGLVLASTGVIPGLLLFGLGLWLRLGLYPFIEATIYTHWDDYERLAYSGISLVMGTYLIMRVLSEPLPDIVHWLSLITILLSGLLTWLTEQRPKPVEGQPSKAAPLKTVVAEKYPSFLVWFMLTEGLLLLLAGPLPEIVVAAYVVGLILSVVALWVTPRLGRPRLNEGAWSWPYLPAAAATMTLIGLPFSLGWLARLGIYEALFFSADITIALLAMLAEGLAMSGLVCYWLVLWQSGEENGQRAAVGIVATIPFLIPGLAPFILSMLTETDLPPLDFGQPVAIFVALGAILVIATGLGYFKDQIINRLQIEPIILAKFLHLHWLFSWGETGLMQLSKFILRVRVILEGQHYLGWALFTALIGALVIFLGT